jgi:hypothetical protein
VIESPEILEVIHQVPHLDQYMRGLYECKYNGFFESLGMNESLGFAVVGEYIRDQPNRSALFRRQPKWNRF